jgi:hypothetical protein
MSMTFKVDGAEVRKTKAGKDYLAVRIGDKTVSFFEAADVAVPVKAGDAITCDVTQSGRFWNGKNVRVVDAKTAKVTPFPAEGESSAAPVPGAPGKVASQPGELGQVVKGGSWTYFIDVRVAKNGQKYLAIKQSEGAGKESPRIMVFADHVDEFADAVEKARKAMK